MKTVENAVCEFRGHAIESMESLKENLLEGEVIVQIMKLSDCG